MADPWNFAGESVSLLEAHGGTVTLIEGSAFCISGRSGDVVAALAGSEAAEALAADSAGSVVGAAVGVAAAPAGERRW